MLDAPKIIEEARQHRYHKWAGNPKGWSYKEGYCAYEVWGNMLCYQCQRKNGYGPNELYCKQHANKVKELGE